VVTFAVLRRTHLRWPLYALAGAGPGLLLLLAEALTRTAGARVVALAGRVSELELTVQRVLSGSRLNSALIVLFAGAITAIVALGRTLGPPAEESDQVS
jgi:NAD(P)-dependent dehydrogenase (short-subunit alcohol dehydrogenase family)